MRPKREGAKRENTVDKTYPIFFRLLILFIGTKLFDMTLFDFYLLCYSIFFPHYFPECKELVGQGNWALTSNRS